MFRTKLRKTAHVASLALLTVGGYLGYQQVTGNFHTVLAGEIYRAAQPTPDQIADYAKRFGIRTIINLRGENAGSAWYDREVARARQLGITHIDFRMSAGRTLPPDRANELVQILKAAPKPVLIHCQGGADRSGLAAALYLAVVRNQDPELAERQISIRFGHIGIPYLSAAYPMDETWETIEEELERMSRSSLHHDDERDVLLSLS